MGEMRRANAREADLATGQRYVSTLAICASIIVGIRLAREDLSRPSPRITATISQGVSMARAILEVVLRRYPRA